MTETELRLIAAPAMIGLSSSPNADKHAGSDRDAESIIDEGDGKILPDVTTPDNAIAEKANESLTKNQEIA